MAHLRYDTRETDIMYVDKANKHYAEKNEIVKFVLKADTGDNKKFKVASFIGKSFGLSGIALEIYCIAAAYYDARPFGVADIINTYKRIYGVRGRNGSWYTAISQLYKKNFFYKNDNNKYVLFSGYRIPKNIEEAKFIVVEIDETDTSVPISI